MPTAPHLFLAISLLSALADNLPAQKDAPQNPVVVTQREQSELRATAYKAENEGRYSIAADAFLKLCRSAPTRIDWVVAAGRCLGRSGRFGEAIDLLETGRKNFPGDIEISAMLARTLLLQTERVAGMMHPEIIWADAAELVEAVLRIHPDHENSRLLLAQARYLLGDWDEAARHANEAVKRHPKRPGAHVLLGRIATDKFQSLSQDFQKLQLEGHEESDLVAAIHKERTRATQAFMRAATLEPTRAHPHVALSRLASIDGKHDVAKRHLHDALAADPDAPVDHTVLTQGMTWQERSDLYQRLTERFSKTDHLANRQRDKKLATLQFHQGHAQLDGLQFDNARNLLRIAIKNNPKAQNAHYYCFLAAYHLEDFDDAESHAAEYARAGAPAFADVLRALTSSERTQIAAMVQYLGDRAFKQQRIINSRDLNHVTACLRDSADAWNNHAFLSRETGDFESAYSSYNHAIEKEPHSAHLWNDAAVILHYHLPSKQNFVKARAMYEQAIELATQAMADKSTSRKNLDLAKQALQDARLNLKDLAEKAGKAKQAAK